ncbi:MAG: glycosyltransferase family 39 protein, partial [Planctomycetes bacterium]|nr:glycosyltransferase family 39 protein [Planctomycetota bacterium]
LAMIVKGDTPQEGAILGKFLNTLMGVLFVLTAWIIGREYDLTAGVVCALLAGSAPWVMYLCGMAYVENGMLFFGMLSVACLGLHADPRRSRDLDWRLVLLAGVFTGLSCGFKYTAVAMIAIPLFIVLCMLAVGQRRSRTHGVPEHEEPRVPASTAQRRARAILHPAAFLLGTLITFSPWLIKNTVMTGNPVFPLAYDSLGAREGIWTDRLANRWQRGHQVETKDSPLKARLGRFKERILVDRRLGWWLIALSLPILFSTARSRLDLGLFMMFVLQAIVWLAFTHLFARFAVVMLIPLCVLGGRSMIGYPHRAYRGVFFVALAAVVAFNVFSVGSIYADELIRKNSEVHGHVEWFYRDCDPDRTVAGYVRQRLSTEDRILMVGEARAFYMPNNVDYCVVFNRNPLAEAVAGAESPEDVIRWLNSKGYTHILVFWNEMHRLRNTYGFWEELTPELFTDLETVGLGVIKNFYAHPARPYATLYEVRAMLPSGETGDGA